ncbi:MAG: peptide ABC transporter substrate-binding protein [Actinomycetota bacterium]
MASKLFSHSYFFMVWLLVASLLGACGGSQSNSSRNSQMPVTSPPASAKTLKLLYWQAPTILNPHLSSGTKDFEASRITLEPLASFDKNGKMVLFLAAEIPTVENGGVAKDGKSVTWKLKKGIKWSDGQPFTAADVAFTYQFVSDREVGANSASSYEAIQNIKVLNDYTVKINFKQPNPAWALPFVGTNGMVLPRHKFESYLGAKAKQAPANLMPIGTGPYRVVEFKPGDMIIYEANPNFREAGKVFFQRVELKGGGDAPSAARAVLQTGDADYAYNPQVEAKILQQLQAAGKGKIFASFGPQIERVMMNFADPNHLTPDGERANIKFPHPFFSDKKVRQAFNVAIDRDAIAQQLYGITGKATANFITMPENLASPNTHYEFNLKKAAALLDEAGWKDTNGNGIRDKNGIEMKVLFQTSVNPLRQKTQEIVKQALTSIGIQVELKSTDASVYFSSDSTNPDNTNHFYADLQMFTTGNEHPDPGAYMQLYLCEQVSQKSNNWKKINTSRYCNPEYEALWKQVKGELNPEKRRQLFIKMNDWLIDDVAVIPIIHRADTAAVSNQLEGVELTPWDLQPWKIQDWKRKSN